MMYGIENPHALLRPWKNLQEFSEEMFAMLTKAEPAPRPGPITANPPPDDPALQVDLSNPGAALLAGQAAAYNFDDTPQRRLFGGGNRTIPGPIRRPPPTFAQPAPVVRQPAPVIRPPVAQPAPVVRQPIAQPVHEPANPVAEISFGPFATTLQTGQFYATPSLAFGPGSNLGPLSATPNRQPWETPAAPVAPLFVAPSAIRAPAIPGILFSGTTPSAPSYSPPPVQRQSPPAPAPFTGNLPPVGPFVSSSVDASATQFGANVSVPMKAWPKWYRPAPWVWPDLNGLAGITPEAGTTSLIGIVKSGTGAFYKVQTYSLGPDNAPDADLINVNILQINSAETIPVGTWLSDIMLLEDENGDPAYYAQPPIWLQ